MCAHMYIYTYINTCVHAYIHTHTYSSTQAHVHSCNVGMHMFGSLSLSLNDTTVSYVEVLHVWMHGMCMCGCMYFAILPREFGKTWIHVGRRLLCVSWCACMCVYVFMCRCIYVRGGVCVCLEGSIAMYIISACTQFVMHVNIHVYAHGRK